jgi:hypothetical protein
MNGLWIKGNQPAPSPGRERHQKIEQHIFGFLRFAFDFTNSLPHPKNVYSRYMEHLTDEELARKLQEEEYETSGVNSSSHSPIFIDSTTDHNNDAAVLEDESAAPFKDLHGLFLAFNDQYFESKLSACEVRWSPRMTRW